MRIQEFMFVTYKQTPQFTTCFRPRIICADGFGMSVQGGRGLYSTPRKNGREYSAAEIGYPSTNEPLIIEYAENPEQPTDTVYPYTPIETIQAVIEKHGGIDIFATFKDWSQ